MDKQIEKRWGIVTLGITMMIVTVLVGNKGSIYAAIWLMVSYYGYKGNLSSIKNLMKWLIFINAIVLCIVLLMFDDKTVGYMSSTKEFLAFGVLAMMVPKIILYFYVDSQINSEAHPVISNKTINQPDQKNTSKAISKIQSMEDAYSNVQTQFAKTNINTSIPTVNEDKFWEMAIEEFDGESRKKGLWAKCFAEADGDENKAKASYLKQRVVELKTEKNKDDLKVSNEKLSNIIHNNPNEVKATTISCPMCRTTNLRTRDDCVSCKYDLRSLKRVF